MKPGGLHQQAPPPPCPSAPPKSARFRGLFVPLREDGKSTFRNLLHKNLFFFFLWEEKSLSSVRWLEVKSLFRELRLVGGPAGRRCRCRCRSGRQKAKSDRNLRLFRSCLIFHSFFSFGLKSLFGCRRRRRGRRPAERSSSVDFHVRTFPGFRRRDEATASNRRV